MKKFLFIALTLLVLFTFVFPILWIYMTAFKPNADIFEASKLFFFTPTLDNFIHLFNNTPFYREITNTLIISVISTAIVMFIATPAAYSFARFNTSDGHLLFTTISTRMFPAAIAALPFFVIVKKFGLMDTQITLIALYTYFNVSFATFLLFGFFREIPEELEKVAMIDGYKRLEILRKIVFPLIKPGLAITTVFCLIFSWNEFLYALLFTRINARTVSVGISAFWGSIEVQWGPMAAGAGLAILPTLIVCWFMQRYIVRGLTFGAVKG